MSDPTQRRADTTAKEKEENIDKISQIDAKLEIVLRKLTAIEKKLDEVEKRVKPALASVSASKPPKVQSVEKNVYEEIFKPQSKQVLNIDRKQGKFFNDEQCLFLSVSLQETLNFMQEQPCNDKDAKWLQMESLKSVISAIQIKHPPPKQVAFIPHSPASTV